MDPDWIVSILTSPSAIKIEKPSNAFLLGFLI
ncbi:hypothetical protein SAMN06295967_110150 [Belliella buryatensis]|uniref:Uncharacterized protein n=1 Tax=Belliella buryatensis TaxID=1500549 RepID=A0A239EVU5_9BACT|nr:hypothetical protein SAMN06295967_110150 [Belliella buryatensis]